MKRESNIKKSESENKVKMTKGKVKNLNERKRRQIAGEGCKKEGYVSAPQKAGGAA